MTLPAALQQAIALCTESKKGKFLSQGQHALHSRYMEGEQSPKGTCLSLEERLAYLVTRLPATFSVCEEVLARSVFEENIDPSTIHSLLDVGAGPATASWAAMQIFPALSDVTLIERDRAFAELGQQLSREAPLPLRKAHWIIADLTSASASLSRRYDLVICSYSLGELSADQRTDSLTTLWQQCNHSIVLIEPGTPRGAATILAARSTLLAEGAALLAPCPHSLACPLASGKQWCHFAKRVLRSNQHRAAKSASLNYEDEKFSYLIASRYPPSCTRPPRLLSSPKHHSGHLSLQLCREGRVDAVILSRRHQERYRLAKKLEWGDCFPDSLPPESNLNDQESANTPNE